MTRVIHKRLDPNRRKACHFSETCALPLLSVMAVAHGSQALAGACRLTPNHIQALSMEIQTNKSPETEVQIYLVTYNTCRSHH